MRVLYRAGASREDMKVAFGDRAEEDLGIGKAELSDGGEWH